MFGKTPKETKPSDPSDLLDVVLSSESMKEEEKNEAIQLFDPIDENQLSVEKSYQSPSVNTVEKISNIISPYFIVIVGLLLYKDNFLFGTVLIAIGILSLLKVSWKEVANIWEDLKSMFSTKDPNQ
jgi:hypothetical protein